MYADTQKPTVSNWTAPNIIASTRILATPLFVWLLIADDGQNVSLRWWATAFFVVAIATDALDGWIARRYNLVTNLGKLLDPIADKVLTGAALIGLSAIGELPWWVTIVVLAREIGVTVHRLFEARSLVVAAAWMGKVKTVAQAVAITLALTPLVSLLGEGMVWVNTVTMTVAVILTVASGIDYVVTAFRMSRAREEQSRG